MTGASVLCYADLKPDRVAQLQWRRGPAAADARGMASMPEDRATTVETAGGQTLTFTQLSGFDELSRCFEFTVGLVGPELDVEADALVNRPMAIEAESGDPKRWFHGLVSEFRLVKLEERVASYEVVLRPWLWLLGLSYDCRIFQNLSVVEIVEEIFGKYPEADFEKRLQKTYPPREYCVQYDESDLDFVQRLLEHEGIFYFFEYDAGGHTLVLADAIAQAEAGRGLRDGAVPFRGQPRRAATATSSPRWLVASSLRPAAYAHTDYNFETPSLSLLTQSEAEPVAKLFRGESYRQPGAHPDLSLGEAVAAIRREELQAPHVRVLAGGTVRGLASGCTFKLENYPRDSQNAEHVVLRADYRVVDPEHRPGLDAAGETYRVELVVAPTALPYRPPRQHAAPGDARAADGHGGRAGGRGDLHRRVCPGEGAVPLGPPRQARREQLLLRAGVAGLGRRRLGLHPDPAHRPGGDRRLHRGRSRPADHHRPGLQRRRDAALRPARERDAIGMEVELLARGRRLQRADVRGQGGVGAGQLPGAEGPQAPGQERPHQARAARPVATASTTTPSTRWA